MSQQLVKGILNTGWIQIISFILVFGTNFIMTNLLGASAYGTFTYIFSIIFVVSNIATMGNDFFLVKNLSSCQTMKQWGKFKGVLKHSYSIVAVATIILLFILIIFYYHFDFLKKIGDVKLFYLSLAAFPFAVFLIISQATLQGINKIKESQLPDKIIKPMIFLFFILIAFFLFPDLLQIKNLILFNIVSFILSLLFSIYIINHHIPPLVKNIKPENDRKLWIRSSIYFLLLNTCFMINGRIDILMLGALKNNHDVGIYNVCARLSDVLIFGYTMVNISFAPVISSLYSSNQKEKLQNITTKLVKWTTLLTLPLFLIIIFFSETILSLFGNEFIDGKNALIILCTGQFINIIFGAAAQILAMSGNEKYAFYGISASVILNVVLNYFLTSRYGLTGTAISTALSLVFWNIILLYFVIKKTKIYPAIFGKI